jgi:hypothetical protein
MADAQVADPMGLEPLDLPAVEHDAAGARSLEPGDRANERRLAGAVRADDGDDRPPRHLERDARERLRVAVEQVEIIDHERGRAGRHISVSSPR